MTEATREQIQYRKAKTPIISKYVTDRAQVMAEIAGRGFLAQPGYSYDLINGLELTAKMSLSEINYKILSETIERELKQSGIDYDQAFKNALLVWELEKQGLLGDWDEELAGIKMGMELKEDHLRSLMIAVGARESILRDAKTAIEREAEVYRQTIVGLEDDVADSEVLLANAKLLTAQKKLEVIPILQQIITAEQALIVQEQAKSVVETQLINKTTEVAAKKATLEPDITALKGAVERHTAAIEASIPTQAAITAAKAETIAATVVNTGKRLEEITAKTELDTAESELFNAKHDVDITRLGNEQAIITAQSDGFTQTSAKDLATTKEMLEAEESSNELYRSTKLSAISNDSRDELDAIARDAASDLNRIGSVSWYRQETAKQVAHLNATAKITASLTHLLSM